jgi:hypothetical protein
VLPHLCPCGTTPSVQDYGKAHSTEWGKWYYVVSPCGCHQGDPMRSWEAAVAQWNGTVGKIDVER